MPATTHVCRGCLRSRSSRNSFPPIVRRQHGTRAAQTTFHWIYQSWCHHLLSCPPHHGAAVRIPRAVRHAHTTVCRACSPLQTSGNRFIPFVFGMQHGTPSGKRHLFPLDLYHLLSCPPHHGAAVRIPRRPPHMCAGGACSTAHPPAHTLRCAG